MPRAVNLEERQTLVTEAAWRVLVRDGLTDLSVRKVAAEAGLPPSSLRYTFPTQASVRERAVSLVLERMSARIGRMAQTGSPLERARAILVELLPLDDERRIEMEVSLALGAMAMTDGALRATHEQTHQAVRDFCARALDLLEADDPRAANDVRVTTDGHGAHGALGASNAVGAKNVIGTHGHDARATHALIDGLALHLVRQQLGESTDWAVAVVDEHLRTLQLPRK
jgi:AcrR family transcriptional regulator